MGINRTIKVIKKITKIRKFIKTIQITITKKVRAMKGHIILIILEIRKGIQILTLIKYKSHHMNHSHLKVVTLKHNLLM